jgi:hypothetical protein
VRVDWAIPCRYVEVGTPGGATIIGAGADAALLPHPAPVQVLFAVRFVGAPDELDGETGHPIACRIFNPAGELAGEQRAELKAGVTQLVPGYLAEVIIPMGVVIDAREFGTYHIEFAIDSDQRRVPFHVLEAPSAEAPG